MNWARFEDALSTVLATLEIGTFLIISTTTGDSIFVQYHQSDADLTAEAVADEYLPESRQLGFDGADAMRALGWIPPTVDPAGRLNWHIDVPWPATSAEYRGLAMTSIAVLRDVHHIAALSDLGYRAWIQPRPEDGTEPPNFLPDAPSNANLDFSTLELPRIA